MTCHVALTRAIPPRRSCERREIINQDWFVHGRVPTNLAQKSSLDSRYQWVVWFVLLLNKTKSYLFESDEAQHMNELSVIRIVQLAVMYSHCQDQLIAIRPL
ncbi:hypothetical protein BDZ89DRAFT_1070777 [Hymenopellis radicata]|nr:hypothetical protein BDZ89DRAFT_1070777 [Hymenopellis radicata]